MQQQIDATPPSDLFPTGGGPATLVFSDDAGRSRRLAVMVRALGGTVIGTDGVSGAIARLRGQAGSVVAIVDLQSDGGTTLDDLLVELNEAVADARISLLVIADQRLIDPVTACITQTEVRLVFGFDDADVAAALARLLGPRGLVAEPSAEESARRLADLSEEAARISRALAALSTDIEPDIGSAATAESFIAAVADHGVALATTRAMIRARRLRDQFFDRTLFADPAWDMLLDLYAARLEGRQVAVSSLCIAAAVPPTTALRWIAAMTEHGLLLREPDPYDRRRIFIALSATAAQAMAGLTAAAARVLAPVQA